MENNNLTSMEEMIEKIESFIATQIHFIQSPTISNTIHYINSNDVCGVLELLKKEAILLLPKEKKQIMDGVEWAVDMINEQEKAIAQDDEDYDFSTHELCSEDYYNVMYKK